MQHWRLLAFSSCCKGTFPAPVQLVHQDLCGFFCKAAFQLLAPQPLLVSEVILPQGVGLGVPFVVLTVSPFLQPAEVTLKGSRTLWSVKYKSQLCVHYVGHLYISSKTSQFYF